jgi:hypothetical protein
MENRPLTKEEIALSVLNGLISAMPQVDHPFENISNSHKNQQKAVSMAFSVAGWFIAHREALDRA